MDRQENTQKMMDHWISRSDNDYETMNHLMHSKDYHWALFIGHLVIERLLKAAVVKNTGDHAPLTHDLRRLAKIAGIEADEEQKYFLDTISSFNLNARYDDYKQDFYKKCTKDYALMWIVNIQKLREWIKTKL
jgi:HEPN domain-containing protein